MTGLKPRPPAVWVLLPLIGAVAFIMLYGIAAWLYPGGSQADAKAKGFSWMHNYWCNLLNEKGINGQINRGRPAATGASVVLCLSLISFWAAAAHIMQFTKRIKRIVLGCGFICILLLPFLPTAYHDAIINIAGSFGLLAMAGIYMGIYKRGWHSLFLFGIFNLLLVALNNYLYYVKGMLYYLPLVQKITFLSFLLWICWADLKLYRQWVATKQVGATANVIKLRG